jgi:hypothetical protein
MKGEPMSNIYYICDRRKCDNCHDECHLTKDINHAVMFRKDIQGNYIERITIPEAVHTEEQLTKLLIEELKENYDRTGESE